MGLYVLRKRPVTKIALLILKEREREERKQMPIMMMTQQSKIKRDNY